MKLAIPPSALRNSSFSRLRPLLIPRSYATQNTSNASAAAKRRAVTPFNDDGHVPWRDLSAGEKTARATQQTFNFGLVVVGVVLTVRFVPVVNTSTKDLN